MKAGDLVVVEIGSDVAVGRERTRHCTQRIQPDAKASHAITIFRTVVANRSADYRRTTEQLQRVGDVARAAAKFAPHVLHQKRHADLVRRPRHDVLGKAPRKHANRVKGHRATNQDAGFGGHAVLSGGKKESILCSQSSRRARRRGRSLDAVKRNRGSYSFGTVHPRFHVFALRLHSLRYPTANVRGSKRISCT